jgi:hypothetical protein
MKLIDLKKWINSLPDEFLDYGVVNGEEGELDDEFFYRIDKPIVSCMVDEETKEIVICNQIDLKKENPDDSKEYIKPSTDK